MKNSILCCAVAACLACAAAHAEDSVNDVAASLSVTGTVSKSTDIDCSIRLSQETLSLSQNMSELIDQGKNDYAQKGAPITISSLEGGQKCYSQLEDGKLAYRFIGTADNADGTVLANADSSETGAKGVGIGIFGSDFAPLKVNSDTLTAGTKGSVVNFALVKLTGQQPVAGNIQTTLTIQLERL